MPKMKRALATGLVIATTPLAACAPVMERLDNPLDGAVVNLTPEQPLQVVLSDNEAGRDWVYVDRPLTAIKAGGQTRSAAGAMATEVFDFTATATGVEKLTFAYRAVGALAQPGEETITLTVKVG